MINRILLLLTFPMTPKKCKNTGQEYNTYSNVREDLSDDEDALIFLRGVIVN